MAWYDIFGGSIAKSIENIATEFIETDMESAEAKALMVKTLDPNGLMRKQISKDVTLMYKIYLFTSLTLLIFQFFGIGNIEQIKDVTSKLIELFLPITGMFSMIVGASFGVNAINTMKGKD